MEIHLQYQVKKRTFGLAHDSYHYEVRDLHHKCDDSKNDRDNLDDAIDIAVKNGCDLNKIIRWEFVD